MQWAEYIVSPEDTLAGIALARDTSIREIKRVNKLWSDTLWPGQKLRVPRRADKERPGRAQSVPSVRTQVLALWPSLLLLMLLLFSFSVAFFFLLSPFFSLLRLCPPLFFFSSSPGRRSEELGPSSARASARSLRPA